MAPAFAVPLSVASSGIPLVRVAPAWAETDAGRLTSRSAPPPRVSPVARMGSVEGATCQAGAAWHAGMGELSEGCIREGFADAAVGFAGERRTSGDECCGST